MSGLVSNTGLFSGLPTNDIINQLMAIEAQPLARIQARIAAIQGERVAYSDLQARLLSLEGAANQFDSLSFFRSARALSTNPGVLTATAREGAVSGTYGFRVHSLVSSHQLISAGFADADRTPVGRGVLSIEMGAGHVAPSAYLEDLGGGRTIGRGTIEVRDQSGAVARLDLSQALTLQDVLTAFNAEPLVDVRAAVSGDRIVLTDTSGGTGELVVRDVGGGTMARDLGITGSVSAAEGRELRGEDIHDLHDGSSLQRLNDHNGVRRLTSGSDLVFNSGGSTLFEVQLNDRMDQTTHLAMLNSGNGVELGALRVDTADGNSVEVDLAAQYTFAGESTPRAVQTIADVLEVLNAATPAGAFSAELDINTNQLVIRDLTEGDDELRVSDVSGAAAADLGLLQDAEEGVLRGAEVYAVRTAGDVLRAINFAAGNYDVQSGTRLIEAELSDNGFRLHSTVGDFEVQSGSSGQRVSDAADDLGLLGSSAGGVLESRRLLAGPGTVLLRSLNGGRGVPLGVLEITAKDGKAMIVDLGAAGGESGRVPQSLGQVIERINDVAASLAVDVRAEVNAAGNGLAIVDHSGGTGALVVADTAGARSLGLAGSVSGAGSALQGANLQLQYLSRTTLLADMNQGNGVGLGAFEIENAAGGTVRIEVTENQKTLGELIDLVNIRGQETGLRAELNDNGDGLVIRDTSGGDGELRISDRDGQVAHGLRLTGEADTRTVTVEDPENPGSFLDVEERFIDGSFETRIDISADDTLNALAEKINRAGINVAATVINDGSDFNAFRLSLTSAVGGSAGRLVFDPGTSGLDMSTLVAPRDAVVSFGGSGSISPILIRSSSNSLTDVIDNVTIDLVAPSEELVELTVSPDVDTLVEAMQNFVSSYNTVVERIGELTFFNGETFETGILRGDPTINQLESRLRSLVSGVVDTGDSSFNRFADIGITFATGGTVDIEGVTVTAGRDGTLELDESRFREAFAENPEAVRRLFTLSETVDQVQVSADGTEQVVIDPETGEARQEFRGLGLGFRIAEILDLLTRSGDGILARRDDALGGQERVFNQRAESISALLDAKRARLERQFANLEDTIAALTSQQSSLSAFQGQLVT